MQNNLKENLLWFYRTPSLKGLYCGIFLFLLFFIFCLFFPYRRNKIYYGQVVLENQVLLYVEEKNRIYLKSMYEINRKNTKCRLEKSNKEYLILDNQKYFEIYLNCEFDEKYLVNEILEVKISLPKTTLWKELKLKLMKGLTT